MRCDPKGPKGLKIASIAFAQKERPSGFDLEPNGHHGHLRRLPYFENAHNEQVRSGSTKTLSRKLTCDAKLTHVAYILLVKIKFQVPVQPHVCFRMK